MKNPGVKKFTDVRTSLRKHRDRSFRTRSLAQINAIALHHSATTSGSAEAFARYHVETLGWPGIGYHYVIEKDGEVKYCNDLTTISFHVGNSNSRSIGICLVGNFTQQEPTKEQWESMYTLLEFLMKKLPNVKSVTNIMGHQEFPGYSSKPCPSLDMGELRGNLQVGSRRPVATRYNNRGKVGVKIPQGFSKPNPDYYVIQEGDTLWQIAHNHDGITMEELIKLNPGINPRSLRVGQRIRMKPAATQAPQKETNQSGVHVVISGDTLWRLSQRYGVTVDQIKATNKLKTDILSVGQRLVIPQKQLVTPTPAPTPKPAPAPRPPKMTAPNGILRRGARGVAVRQLQECLNAVRFNCGTPDGIFGPRTEDALRRFQSVHANPVDGVYGPKSQRALQTQLDRRS